MDQNNSDIKPTSLRISTMTATCKINSNINLEEAAKMFIEIIKEKTDIKYIEHGKTTAGVSNKNISEKKAAKKKVFYNQMTVLVNLYEGKSNNIKLFNNGAISMTGLKSVEDGKKAVEIVLKYMKTNNLILENIDSSINNFKIVLINSDYYIGYEIKRSELHQLLINKYQIFSSYEPCIYPGVNSKFYWNEDYFDKQYKGKCYCLNPCDGKGCGKGDGNCKKITISAFQSGSVIITGARNIDQIQTAYNFINKIFKDNYEFLRKQNAPFLELDDIDKNFSSNKNIIYLKKSNIVNYS
jgi:TATA-box binding protein (TBP) (component of TFIID and TFIIIB)